MRSIIRPIAALCILYLPIITVSLPAFNAAADQTITISSIQGSLSGQLATSILRRAYTNLGITLKSDPQAADVAAARSQSGRTDGEMQRIESFGDAYPSLIRVDEPLFFEEGVAYTKELDIALDGVESLRPYRVAIPQGVLFTEQMTKDLDPIRAPSITALFRLLEHGKADAIILTRKSGLHTIKRLRLKGIRALEPPLNRHPIFHYLHKRHEALVPRITAELKRLRETGVIANLENAFNDRVFGSTQ